MVFFSDQDGKQGIYNCWPNDKLKVSVAVSIFPEKIIYYVIKSISIASRDVYIDLQRDSESLVIMAMHLTISMRRISSKHFADNCYLTEGVHFLDVISQQSNKKLNYKNEYFSISN